MKDESRIYLVEFLLISVAVIWGINFSLIKTLYNYFHPLAFNAVRMTIATLTMVSIIKMRGVQLRVERRDLPSLIGLGILSNAGYQMFFVLGLARTRAGNVGLLLSLTPVFAYLIGLALKQERFNERYWLESHCPPWVLRPSSCSEPKRSRSPEPGEATS